MILVMASCSMGVLVGMAIGYTMTLLESLILQKSLGMFFPWQQFVVVMIVSFLYAIFSTFGPTPQLTNNEIPAIFRMI